MRIRVCIFLDQHCQWTRKTFEDYFKRYPVRFSHSLLLCGGLVRGWPYDFPFLSDFHKPGDLSPPFTYIVTNDSKFVYESMFYLIVSPEYSYKLVQKESDLC